MSVVKADRFTALKAKVKAEMLRRNQSGSVAEYGGSAYDYTDAPAAGRTVRAEHRDKLVEPMRAVNADTVPASPGAVIGESELANLETRVQVWGARSMTDQSGSDCKSGCTGTCYTGCATGCSGDCDAGCYGCGRGCDGGCTGTCKDTCKDECDGCIGCGGCQGCGQSCAANCSGCGSGCSANCAVGASHGDWGHEGV